ncbi:MAG TPA: hypothetical protein VL463_23885, partial [Kofleriaceae bacterium]|nr:hypothetical protein [Kofleriaceae bacterium]
NERGSTALDWLVQVGFARARRWTDLGNSSSNKGSLCGFASRLSHRVLDRACRRSHDVALLVAAMRSWIV